MKWIRLTAAAISLPAAALVLTTTTAGTGNARPAPTSSAARSVYTGLDQAYAVICADEGEPRKISD